MIDIGSLHNTKMFFNGFLSLASGRLCVSLLTFL
jgi:hypothetical protein